MSPISRKQVRPLPAEQRASMLNRLRSARGHLDAIITMIEQDAYCVDVLKQISAVRSALDKVGRLELRHHFLNCFSEAVKSGKAERAADELLEALSFNKELFSK
ncbi:MAG: metal-sensitive transcriptional regulator [Candidatus Baltobacteraceae bacterium]